MKYYNDIFSKRDLLAEFPPAEYLYYQKDIPKPMQNPGRTLPECWDWLLDDEVENLPGYICVWNSCYGKSGSPAYLIMSKAYSEANPLW